VFSAVADGIDVSVSDGSAVVLAEELSVAVGSAVPLPVEVPVPVWIAVPEGIELSEAEALLLWLEEELLVKLLVPVAEGSVDGELIGVPDDMNENVAAGDEVPDSLGVREYDSSADFERLASGDGDIDLVTVFVFELVNEWDGLDECVEVLDVVVVVLTDVDTLGDCVTRALTVCDTDTVEDFELVWLSVGVELSE
jgi:hypothetical protein